MPHINIEISRCILCHDAPCTSACSKGKNPAKGIMSLRFMNQLNAGVWFGSACADCDAPCEKACVLNSPIQIKHLAASVQDRDELPKFDMGVDFCGIHAENPFFLGSAVEASGYDMIARAFEMGWAGAFYKTISFMHIKEVSPRFDSVNKESTAFIGFRNMEQLSEHDPRFDFEVISRLKRNFPSKIMVASIMGRTEDEWTQLASMAEQAGADMIECNFSCPQMTAENTGSDVGQSPDLVRAYSAATRRGTKLPILAKMTPNITHIADPAAAAIEGGADGIAAINTIKSITFSHRSRVNHQSTISGYSGKAVKPIAERMILEITSDRRTRGVPVSGIGGIETWRDAGEYIMLGCGIVQVVTSIMQYGYRIIDDLKSGLSDFMIRHGISSIEALRGSAIDSFVQPSELDRDTYCLPKFDREKCVGCGRCYISCSDGGHQAITFGEDRKPHLIGRNCVGCMLCLLICPTSAVSATNRVPKPQK